VSAVDAACVFLWTFVILPMILGEIMDSLYPEKREQRIYEENLKRLDKDRK
jgi:hypothetical protein